MSATSDALKQVRLDPDNYVKLCEIKRDCEWPVSLGTIANYSMRKGFAATKRTFNIKPKK